MKTKEARSYALFHFASTAVEETILVLALLALLPRFGIRAPLWLVVVIVGAWAAWAYVSYRLVRTVIGKPPSVGPEALIGLRCRTTSALAPVGYVRAGSELWRAQSLTTHVEAEAEVVVASVSGLTLLVVPATDAP